MAQGCRQQAVSFSCIQAACVSSYLCVSNSWKKNQGAPIAHIVPCCRQKTVKEPVASFVCEILPEQMRESTRTELMYEDLVRLPATEVSRIAEWLMEKVDSYTVRVRPEPTPEEEVRSLYIVTLSGVLHPIKNAPLKAPMPSLFNRLHDLLEGNWDLGADWHLTHCPG